MIQHKCGLKEDICDGTECECESGEYEVGYYECEHCCGCGELEK